MEHRDWKNSLQETAGRHASRRGAFSAGLTALAVAAVLVFNLLAAQLPEQWAQIDLTGSGIYNISETSQDYLAGLEDDVVIHVLTDKDTLDTRIVRFLDIYADLSDHLTLEYTDPTVYPSALSQYGVGADTIVVTCEATGRQESFDISDIIGYDMMSYYYYGTYTETDFDGESLLTSAIDSVLTGVTRMVYETTGHNETAVPISVKERFTRLHMSVERVNLLTDGGIPEDCSLLILNEPDQDLADDELDMILNYLAEGGQVIYNMAGELVDLPNFNALCAAYGMQVADGMIADTSQGYQNNPYLFFAQADTSVDAASSLTSDSMVLFYASRGFTLADPTRDTITVQPFLTTTENGYAVLDADNMTQGTYVVGAVATEEISEDTTARLTVYGADTLINTDVTNSFDAHQYHHDRRHLGPAVYPGDPRGAADLRLCPLDAPPETVTKEHTSMNRTQKKTLVLLLGILVGLGILLAVVSAVKRSSAQREAEEAAAQDAASVITETEAAYSSLTYDNGSATLSFHLDEAGKWVWSDDPEFPLDDSTIQSILTLLTNLKPQQTITEGDTLEAYGLDQPFATLTAAKPDGGTLTISLGNTTTDGNSYYMLMNEQESPVYIISNSLYTEMSKTIYDMCDLPELPQLTEENLQSVTVEGAASTLLRPIDKETSTDEETGEETVTVTWAASGEDVTGNADTASLLAELGALTFTKCVDYKPTDEAAALCGFDAPQATVTILYLNDTGTEGTLTLTFGSENLDQTGYYVRMEGDSTIYQMDTASVDTILSVAENGLTAADATGE